MLCCESTKFLLYIFKRKPTWSMLIAFLSTSTLESLHVHMYFILTIWIILLKNIPSSNVVNENLTWKKSLTEDLIHWSLIPICSHGHCDKSKHKKWRRRNDIMCKHLSWVVLPMCNSIPSTPFIPPWCNFSKGTPANDTLPNKTPLFQQVQN